MGSDSEIAKKLRGSKGGGGETRTHGVEMEPGCGLGVGDQREDEHV